MQAVTFGSVRRDGGCLMWLMSWTLNPPKISWTLNPPKGPLRCRIFIVQPDSYLGRVADRPSFGADLGILERGAHFLQGLRFRG